MKRVILCLRGPKALAFAAHFFKAYSAREGLFAYIDGEKNVAHPVEREIQALCESSGIPFEMTAKTPKFSVQDTVVSVGWCHMLNASNLFVTHDSLLPKYRGFNPLVTALIAGDQELGVTLLKGVESVDAGPILLQKSVAISYPMRVEEAIHAILPLYEKIAESLAEHLNGKVDLLPRDQDESRVTFSLWRDDQDYRIDWTKSAADIRRFIDAVGFPYLGASSLVNGDPIRIVSAKEIPDVQISNRTNGKVFLIENGCPVIVCGSGLLKITDAVADDGSSVIPFKKLKSRFV